MQAEVKLSSPGKSCYTFPLRSAGTFYRTSQCEYMQKSARGRNPIRYYKLIIWYIMYMTFLSFHLYTKLLNIYIYPYINIYIYICIYICVYIYILRPQQNSQFFISGGVRNEVWIIINTSLCDVDIRNWYHFSRLKSIVSTSKTNRDLWLYLYYMGRHTIWLNQKFYKRDKYQAILSNI